MTTTTIKQLTNSTINMKTPAHLNNEFIYTHHTESPTLILRIHHRCVLNGFPSHPRTEWSSLASQLLWTVMDYRRAAVLGYSCMAQIYDVERKTSLIN
jgi:hypothetical protein